MHLTEPKNSDPGFEHRSPGYKAEKGATLLWQIKKVKRDICKNYSFTDSRPLRLLNMIHVHQII